MRKQSLKCRNRHLLRDRLIEEKIKRDKEVLDKKIEEWRKENANEGSSVRVGGEGNLGIWVS